MRTKYRYFMGIALGALALGALARFDLTSHPSQPRAMGTPSQWAAAERATADEPGPIRLEEVVAADWKVDLGGMLNLDHPEAVHAGIENREEPIQIKFYVIRHPERGTFLIDTGVARSIARRSEEMPIGSLVRAAMNADSIEVRLDTKTWLERSGSELAGVFLTHLHLDHILGLEDVPKTVPLYVGPEEARDSRFSYLFARGTTNENLAGFGPLRELSVGPAAEREPGVVDIFGDGSFYGIHVPGHTRGSMAFLVRTTEGPALITGDACHTAWGWSHSVEPGSFNTDGAMAEKSLQALERLAGNRPRLRVYVGHQQLPSTRASAALD